MDELQKQNHEEDHNSRRLSISSDQSSSLEQSSPLSASSSSSVSHKDPIENEKCKKSDSYIETTDDPSNVDEPTEITNKEEKLQNQEKRISVSTSNSIQEQQTKLGKRCIERLLTSLSIKWHTKKLSLRFFTKYFVASGSLLSP